jgi:integrase/recombinase XerD
MTSLALRPADSLAARPAQTDREMQLENLWLHGLSRHTRRAYVADLRRFRKFAAAPLPQINLGEIQAFADHLATLPLRPGSRHRILSGVKSFFAYAHRLGYLPFDIARPLRLPSGKDTLNERILSPMEVQSLISACEPGRDRLIAEMLYYCGLRVSELASLTLPDATARKDGGQITVFGKGGKTRTVLVPAFLWDELNSQLATRNSQLLFPLSTSQVTRIIHAAAARAGIKKPVSAHWLRHCHCSHALEAGADLALIQATVGHANIATTSRYLHARPDRSSSSFLQRPAAKPQTGNPHDESNPKSE